MPIGNKVNDQTHASMTLRYIYIAPRGFCSLCTYREMKMFAIDTITSSSSSSSFCESDTYLSSQLHDTRMELSFIQRLIITSILVFAIENGILILILHTKFFVMQFESPLRLIFTYTLVVTHL